MMRAVIQQRLAGRRAGVDGGRRFRSWLLSCVVAAGCFWAQATEGGQTLDLWRGDGPWFENTVAALAQTADGYLWLGTYHGLVRFDGVRFTVFDSSNTPGLPNSRITSLYEAGNGTLWIGHETGELTRLREGRFEAVVLAGAWPGGAIEAIATDADEDLWVLNDAGVLFRVRDGLRLECPGGAAPNRGAVLARQQNGTLWITADGQIGKVDGESVRRFQFPGAPEGEYYQRVAGGRRGALWLVTNQGRIRKWTAARGWEEDPGTLPAGAGVASAVLERRDGGLVVGTLTRGLYVFAPGEAPQHFNRDNGLSHNWVRCLCEDHEGNIWIGTGGGLDTLRPRKVSMLSPPDGLQGCAALSFDVGKDGAFWVGTEGAGLYRYQSGSWTRFAEPSGLGNQYIWSVLQRRNGDLLVGTWGAGLFVRRGDSFETAGETGPVAEPVVALHESRDGDLWVGTTAGLRRYQEGKLVWSVDRSRLMFPDVRAITEAPDGTIWFGMSGGGLGALRDGELTVYRKSDGLPSNFVQALLAEADGTLWIGTSDAGLGRWRAGRFSRIGRAEGLPAAALCHLVDDGTGNLWISSNRGIFRLNKIELNRCAEGELPMVRCISYGKAEGLATLVCSGGFNPGARQTEDGHLWFPTAKGLASIDPANVTINPVPPPVVIEELLADGVSVDLKAADGELRIPPGRQRFEVRYTALSFVAPEKVRFRYKLEGLEAGWTEAGSQRFAQYSYLPPGGYRFRVIACNNDDIWNERGAVLAFTVLPQVWQTWWFRAGSLMVGAMAVSAAVLALGRQRVRRKLEQLERQRALERERARIARDIHDDLGASLTRITLLSQSARAELDGQAQAAADVDQIYSTARELTRAMDEIVWAVNPKHDTLDSLVTYLGRFAQSFLSSAGLRCRLDVPLNLPHWTITSESRHNLYLTLKEALNNVIKHAGATEVRVCLELRPQGFTLTIIDNGRGFDPGSIRGAADSTEPFRTAGGNGLANMQRRMEEIGGQCEWQTARGEGTRVVLTLPVKSGLNQGEPHRGSAV